MSSVRPEGSPSPPDLLVLHAVRVMGMADPASVVRRTGLGPEVVHEQLLDDQARGWVQHVVFADLAGWALTESGRAEGERRLADELDRTGARGAVDAAHTTFVRQNARFLHTVTRWVLTGALERFVGYDVRYATALERADAGHLAWVDAPGVESCHTVWIQLHEDLVATLGVERGAP